MKNKKLYLLIIILFMIIINPTKVDALSLKIDTNGKVSRITQYFGDNGSMPDDVFYSYFNFDGNTLTLNNSNEQYFLEIYKDIKITSTTDATIGYSFVYSNITIESNYSITYSSNNDTNGILTIKNTNITLPQVGNYKKVIIENCHSKDGKGVTGSIRLDSGKYGTVSIDNSTFNGSLEHISKLDIKDSEVNTSTILSDNNYEFNMSMSNSTLNSNQLLIFKESNEPCTITDSIVDIKVIQGVMQSTSMVVVMEVKNSKFKSPEVSYMTFKFSDSEVELGSSWVTTYYDNCTVTLKGSGSYKEIHAVNSKINAEMLSMLGHNDDVIELDATECIVNGKVGSSQQNTIITNNSILTASDLYTRTLVVDKSTIKVNELLLNSSDFTNSISNSTLNLTQLQAGSAKYLDIIDSYINTATFSAPNAYINLLKSKIISYNTSVFRLSNFKHSYFLTDINNENNSGKVSVNILLTGDDVNYISTNKNNELIEPNNINISCTSSYPDRCNNISFTEYDNVLLRDKINITFKVVNGTWEDGSSTDIVLSKYAFDELDKNDVPTNMIPNEGYINGSWDLDIVYDDLKDDYIYTYTFNKKEVKGVEEIKENPKTGVFTYTSLIMILLMISLYIHHKYKCKTLYKYNQDS